MAMTTPKDTELERLQSELARLPSQELIMLGLAELIAFMPCPTGYDDTTRGALWRELWRRGMGRPVIKEA